MKKPNTDIALFLGYLGGGGAEKVMLNLGVSLAEQGLKVDLVLGKAWGSHLEKIPSELSTIDLKASSPWKTVKRLANYLREKQPQALLSALHYTNEIAILAKQIARVPTRIVVSEHNTISKSLTIKNKFKKFLTPQLVKYLYPLADGIVAVSHGVAEDLADTTGLSLKRIQTIYNPVVNSELLEKAGEKIDHPWFISSEIPVILGVGKLEAQKNFPNLIHAFDRVRKVKPAKLAILGWGPDREQLEALIKDLGLEADAALLGYVNNPYPYMARAKVFVLSSAWEGLPTVLIEAMATGTPVVSTNCKSGPEEILDNGKYGWLEPVDDSHALADSILKVLSGQTKSIDPSWLDQFKSETIISQYLNILKV